MVAHTGFDITRPKPPFYVQISTIVLISKKLFYVRSPIISQCVLFRLVAN